MENRDALREVLTHAAIAVGMHYPTPLHRQEAYASLGLGRGSFPNAVYIAACTLSLPMYPELQRSQVNAVADTIQCHVERQQGVR